MHSRRFDMIKNCAIEKHELSFKVALLVWNRQDDPLTGLHNVASVGSMLVANTISFRVCV